MKEPSDFWLTLGLTLILGAVFLLMLLPENGAGF